MYKKDIWVNQYLDSLEQEISQNYKNEQIKTLYIGGGTPSSLNLKQLKKLFQIIKIFNLKKDAEITFECNIEDITEEKLEFLKNKINRLSIGVQTFDKNLIKILNRKPVDINKINLAKKYFTNINIDLMYGFNEENETTLKKDLKQIIDLNIPHISIYNLIIEENTKLYINNYKKEDESLKCENIINETLEKHDYIHYEISNYAKENYQSKHNLTYWNNENYYGFGLGAAGYINDVRYENTRSLTQYLKGNYKLESHKLDENEKLQNEFILGLRKIKGINKNKFKQKYNFNIKEINQVTELLKRKYLKEDKKNIYINPKYLYYSNEILIKFLEPSLHKQ